jgi:ribokinase
VSLVVVGSLNADLVARVERFPQPGETATALDFAVFPGGKGANQAYAAARLGASVRMVGQVGRDAHGDLLVRSLASAGVDVALVARVDDAPTGLALITVDHSGQNHIVVVAGANGSFGPDRLRAAEALFSASALLLQLEVPLATVEAAARAARDAGVPVVLDPAPAQAIPDRLLELADYVTPNETELLALAGGVAAGAGLGGERAARAEAAARRLLGRGAHKVVVKMGEAGALLVTAAGAEHWPPFPVAVLDTTAAGDAFNAAFAVALSEGRSERDAGRFACAAGALCATRAGAQPSMPTRSEVVELMGR